MDRHRQIMQIAALGKAVRRISQKQYQQVISLSQQPDLSEQEEALITVFSRDIESGYIAVGR
ncbi:MAG: hypothetical protein AAFN18_11830 [Cyanobacteria bacterium J06554_6]